MTIITVGSERDVERQVLHVLEDVVVRAEFERLAEELRRRRGR